MSDFLNKDYWQEVVEIGFAALPSLTVLGALFTWLFKFQFDKAIERYKGQLTFQFNNELEAYKKSLQEDLEKYKSELKLWADTIVVRRTRAHKETVDRLCDIYVVFEELDKLAGFAQYGASYEGAAELGDDVRNDSFILKANEAESMCFTSRLFVSDELFTMIKSYANGMQLFAEQAISARQRVIVDSPQSQTEALKSKLKDALRPLLDQIRDSFRAIINEG